MVMGVTKQLDHLLHIIYFLLSNKCCSFLIGDKKGYIIFEIIFGDY